MTEEQLEIKALKITLLIILWIWIIILLFVFLPTLMSILVCIWLAWFFILLTWVNVYSYLEDKEKDKDVQQ